MRLFNIMLRAAAGSAGIFVLDILFSPFGLCVGINPFTAAVCGLLGLPGAGMLYALAYLL